MIVVDKMVSDTGVLVYIAKVAPDSVVEWAIPMGYSYSSPPTSAMVGALFVAIPHAMLESSDQNVLLCSCRIAVRVATTRLNLLPHPSELGRQIEIYSALYKSGAVSVQFSPIQIPIREQAGELLKDYAQL